MLTCGASFATLLLTLDTHLRGYDDFFDYSYTIFFLSRYSYLCHSREGGNLLPRSDHFTYYDHIQKLLKLLDINLSNQDFSE